MMLVIVLIIVILTSPLSANVGHVVMFATPLFGHIIPLLDFAKQLSMHHHVTIVISAALLDVLEQRHLLFNNNEQNSRLNQNKIEWIGLFDGNTFDHTVS
jgi:hypothetical protein